MANTYVKIASTTVGAGGASSVTFSSIPQTYTDLVLKISARDDSAGGITSVRVRPNGLTTNLTTKRLYGYSGAAGADQPGVWLMMTSGSLTTANTFGNSEMYIFNYTSSNFKSSSIDAVMENNSATEYELEILAGLWSDTAAITSLGIFPAVGNSVQYSTFTLYGIKNS
jgi:hypothetical protein